MVWGRMSYRSVILLLTPAVAGILLGLLLGGRLSGLAAMRLRAFWLLWVAAGVQFCQYYVRPVRDFIEGKLGIPILAVVFGIVVVWLAVNISRAGRSLRVAGAVIMLGAALNGGVILANNGHMPYAVSAARLAGLHPAVAGPKNRPADQGTRLVFLGDTVPLPGLRKVLSPGDVCISLGAVAAIIVSMRRRPAESLDSPGEAEEVRI